MDFTRYTSNEGEIKVYENHNGFRYYLDINGTRNEVFSATAPYERFMKSVDAKFVAVADAPPTREKTNGEYQYGRRGVGLQRYWEGKQADPEHSRSSKHGRGFLIRFSQVEFAELEARADALGISKTELITRALAAYKEVK